MKLSTVGNDGHPAGPGTLAQASDTPPDHISPTRRSMIWMSYRCNKQFSLKVGTSLGDSPLGLDKWMMPIWMVGNFKNGVSSNELQSAIGVTQKSAWFMLHRFRAVMYDGYTVKLSGEVEADETVVAAKRGTCISIRMLVAH